MGSEKSPYKELGVSDVMRGPKRKKLTQPALPDIREIKRTKLRDFPTWDFSDPRPEKGKRIRCSRIPQKKARRPF